MINLLRETNLLNVSWLLKKINLEENNFDPRVLCRSRFLGDFGMPEALWTVIIDHSYRLHERITDR